MYAPNFNFQHALPDLRDEGLRLRGGEGTVGRVGAFLSRFEILNTSLCDLVSVGRRIVRRWRRFPRTAYEQRDKWPKTLRHVPGNSARVFTVRKCVVNSMMKQLLLFGVVVFYLLVIRSRMPATGVPLCWLVGSCRFSANTPDRFAEFLAPSLLEPRHHVITQLAQSAPPHRWNVDVWILIQTSTRHWQFSVQFH